MLHLISFESGVILIPTRTMTCAKSYLYQMQMVQNLLRFIQDRERESERELTRVKLSYHGSTFEVTRTTFVFISLVITIKGKRGMIPDCVGQKARLVWLLHFAAVCSTFPASPV